MFKFEKRSIALEKKRKRRRRKENQDTLVCSLSNGKIESLSYVNN
jgi:hypothetical protein